MHIAIVSNSTIPAAKYGGIERVIWWLGKELVKMNHKVTFVVNPGSTCPFANIIYLENKPLHQHIPDDVDVVHYNSYADPEVTKPHLTTIHGNINTLEAKFNHNIVAISGDQAKRMNAEVYVHNGLDFADYGVPDLNNSRNFFHFLGDAAWKVKNVKGAIKIAAAAHEKIAVLGGKRFRTSQGIKFSFALNAKFYGKVGGAEKNDLLNQSKGLIFPVLWNEPFGLALVESLYFGCPVFGTPYGSLPEIVIPEVGFLSDSYSALADAVRNASQYSRKRCHEYAVEHFSSAQMAKNYVSLYEKILNGELLNKQMPAVTSVVPDLLPMRP